MRLSISRPPVRRSVDSERREASEMHPTIHYEVTREVRHEQLERSARRPAESKPTEARPVRRRLSLRPRFA
jgi:hypothetical protein